MKQTVSFVLMATAIGCGSDVDLQLEGERGPDPLTDSSPPIGQPSWSKTDFAGSGHVSAVAWATDGGLVASVSMRDVAGQRTRSVSRYEADGTPRWAVENDELAFLTDVTAIEGGGAVVATIPPLDASGPNGLAGLDWFDADGNLTASWSLDATDTNDAVREVQTVQPLPDGGVVWAGRTLRAKDGGDFEPVAGRLDAKRQLMWLVPLAVNADMGYQDGGPGAMALTADGGIVLLAGYVPTMSDEGQSASYLVRLEPDGSERWRKAFGGSGYGNGIAVTPSGNVIVAGNFQSWMTVGDLRLEGAPDKYHQFVAELDPEGQEVGLSQLELPASIDSDEIDAIPNTMTMLGEEVLVSGMYYTPSGSSPQLSGYYAATHSLDGALVAALLFPVEVREQGGSGPIASDATPEGRLAIAGSFAGRVDFGNGEVDSGETDDGLPIDKPFIAIFDPVPSDVD